MPRIEAALLIACLAGPAAAAEVGFPGHGDVMLRAELVLPPSGAPAGRAVVVALHGCGGIGGAGAPVRLAPREWDWTERLTALGHPVLWPDSFGSRGLGQACGQQATHPAPPRPVRRGDALAAAEWAASQPWAAPGGVVMLGWSHGGTAAVSTLADPPPGLVRAVVALYPGCGGFRAAFPLPAAPLLMLLGEADNWTDPAPCRRLAARFPGRITAITYPGAGHGFDSRLAPRSRHLPDGRDVTAGRDPAAAGDAPRRVAAFLALHGGPATHP
jgi:dienelactone hydrolase